MSMLAERKSKQRWSLNPRGKAWSEDSTKFGQKMLERMGWSKGKGLGPKEDGMVDHLKISYKNDSKGMGYKDRNDQWTDLDVKFNALLESFSGEKIDENEIKIASLEQKSQSSKVRVHYKKFTRGKDLSRCSEKDLACIFGKRSLKPPQNNETKVEEKEVVENGNFTYNSVSMVDYFKKKLPSYGKSNGYVAKKDSESEEEGYIGLGFTNGKKRKSDDVVINGTPKKVKMQEGLSNPAFDPLCGHVEVQKHVLNTIEEENDGDEEVIKRKKKKDEQNEEIENVEVKSDGTGKKKKKTFDENCEESQNSFVNGNFEVKRKKKTPIDNPSFDINSDTQGSFSSDNFEVKRKKKKEKILTPVDNPSFDITSDTHDSVSSDTFEVKRKKKREKILTPVDNPSFDITSDTHDSFSSDAFEVKRKKKEKTLTPVDNPSFDINSDTQNSISNDAFEVKRKKKKDKTLTPIDDSSLDITQSSFSNDSYEVRRKKKKKKESDGLDNPNFVCQNGDASYEINEFEVKRKKQKLAVDNPVFDSSNECQNSFVDPSFEVKRKKKKKKSEDENTTQEEPEEPSFDLILNVTSTPSLAKAESSSKRRKSVRFSDKIEKRIIPNNEDVENRNELFDINSQVIAKSNDDLEGNIDEISKKIEG